MKWNCFIFALAFLSVSVAAQDKADKVSSSSALVLVNGQPIRGKVLEIDGRHYVAVEDLAQSLHGAIGYGEGTISLTFPQATSTVNAPAAVGVPSPANSPKSASTPAPEAAPTAPPLPSNVDRPADRLENGRIKGALTYFFDFHAGSKPDNWSK